jgi:hypothetical protein
MSGHPLVNKILCVAAVASIMLSLGRIVFPLVDGMIGGLQFDAIEAVVSATLGFGLYAAIFG